MAFLEEVVQAMNIAGNKEVIVICDFDGTLTAPDSEVTMNAMSKYFGYDSDFAKERTSLYEEYGKYLTEEFDKETRFKKLDEWWKAQIGLFKKYNVPSSVYFDAINKLNFALRDGAVEMLNFCEKNDIPVFIISAGLGNLIIPILAFSGCLSMNMRVVSNFIRYDEETPVSYTPVVTPLNKSAHLVLELGSFENYHAVVFGNRDEDFDLIPDEFCTKVKITD